MRLVDAEILACKLMREWDVGEEWKFKWTRGKREMGRAANIRGNKYLALSRYHVELNDEEEVRETILHEIAHIKAGLHNKHNRIWKSWAVKVGANPCRTGHSNMPTRKWACICLVCREILFTRHSRRLKLHRYICPTCGQEKSLGRLAWVTNPDFYEENSE